MSLTYEQLQQMGASSQSTTQPTTQPGGKRFSYNDLIKMGAAPHSPNDTSASLSQATHLWSQMSHQQRIDSVNTDTANQQQEAGAGAFAGNFGTALGKNLARTFLDPALKFGVSAVAAPVDIVRGVMGKDPLKVDPNMKLPSGDSFGQTYQGEVPQITSDVVEGKTSPLAATGHIVGGVVGGAADTLGLSEAIGSKSVAKALDTISSPVRNLLSNRAEKKLASEALDVVTPKLTPKQTEAALAEGRGKGGGLFSKTTIAPDKRTLQIADATKGIVNKGASGADNIQRVKTALNTEAENLKKQVQAVDHPYSFKELNSKLSSVEKPIAIKSDATLSKQFDLARESAMNIAKKNGGTVSSLLDSRKEFDALVEKEFPTLYDRENAPMRNAVTGIRNAMNDFIESNLPSGSGFKDSLRKQSLYYDAIDNIAGNSKGQVAKTGLQNKVGNFIKKHPAISAGAGAILGEHLYSKIKKTTGL